jgi:hypothetical protein
MALPYKLFVTTSGTDANAPRTESVAVTGANTYYSKMWTGGDSVSYSIQVIWTGTPTGTFTLQVSDKPNPIETTDADWVTSTEVAVVNPAGAASQFLVSTVNSPHMKKRLKYVNSAGSGTITGWVTVPHGVT